MNKILTELEGGVLRLQFNRAEKKNAITAAMYQVLAHALRHAERDSAVRVALIHGAPDIFTAGNDLHDFLASPPHSVDAPAFQFLRAIRDFPKPLIAAVSGLAVGVGTTMLLHCDLVYCTPGARFSLPFVNLGLCPEAGSSFLLPRLAGYQRAAELLMLGEPFAAETAKEIGLVNAIVPAEALLATAMATAGKLAAKPAASLRETKTLMKQGLHDAVKLAMDDEGEAFRERLESPEAKEAFSAFLEKRQPDFSKLR
ncbi:MAG: enoyl-CoA hydratase [Betaproteobacteria bacterium RBG_16_64_18]|nr:MAG: enoyl-CoA hydratase [Betaproteobacteria bacterium RBG_16_64_18]OGA08294.1 MAG: enoyl-CoA hydratase [Betaproteobacteria bacterium RIFCSPLOWO2_02_FULL_65_20]